MKISPRKLSNLKSTIRVLDNSNLELKSNDSLTGSFLSLSCTQIFGRGSLECGKYFNFFLL